MFFDTPSDDPAERFAHAILDVCHSLGWMLSRQHEFEKAKPADAGVAFADDDPHEADRRHRRARAGADIPQAWAEVRQAVARVKADAFVPPHALDGIPPAEWRHRVLCDIDEATTLIGGPFRDSPRMGYPSAADRERAAEIIDRLSGLRVRDARNFSAAIQPEPADAGDAAGWPNQAAAAKLFGKDAGNVSRWAKKGDLLSRKSGGSVLIDPLSIVRLLLRRQEEATAPEAATPHKTGARDSASPEFRCDDCGEPVRPRCHQCKSPNVRPK